MAQFLTRDALVALTRRPYNYASNDPLANGDPAGLSSVCNAEQEARERQLQALKEQIARENREERLKRILEEYYEITKAWGKGVAVGGGCYKFSILAGVCEALFEPEPAS